MNSPTLPDRLLAYAVKQEQVRDALGIPAHDFVDQQEIDDLREAAAALSGGEALEFYRIRVVDWNEIALEMPLGDDPYANGYHDAMSAVTRRLNPYPTTPQPGDGWVLVQRHWIENVGYAASMLEDSESRIDQLQAPALRKLIAEMAAAPSAKGVANG